MERIDDAAPNNRSASGFGGASTISQTSYAAYDCEASGLFIPDGLAAAAAPEVPDNRTVSGWRRIATNKSASRANDNMSDSS